MIFSYFTNRINKDRRNLPRFSRYHDWSPSTGPCLCVDGEILRVTWTEI